MSTSQIWQIANLFSDCHPRTCKMVSKELGLKNNSASKHLSTLVYKWRLYEVVKIDNCPITGKKAAFYNTIIWSKKGLNNGK